MVTDTPQIILQFRGNKDYAYIDDSAHIVGEPDMGCILLNCGAAPFNDPTVRRAAAMAINRTQYVKEIDENVLPASHGLFTPGSPYYSATAYPNYNPTEAKKLVKQVEKSTGKPVSFTFGSTNGPASVREQRVPPAGPSGCRLRRQDAISSSRTTSSTTPWPARTRPWNGGSSAPSIPT